MNKSSQNLIYIYIIKKSLTGPTVTTDNEKHFQMNTWLYTQFTQILHKTQECKSVKELVDAVKEKTQ